MTHQMSTQMNQKIHMNLRVMLTHTHSCASLNSWCIPNAGNLKALDILDTQSNADDAVSVVSGSSWALTYQVVGNDDTASVSSFQMVSSVQVVDNDDTA